MGKVEPLAGLSVLRRLGRLEVVHHDGQELLRVVGAFSTDTPTNVLLPKGCSPSCSSNSMTFPDNTAWLPRCVIGSSTHRQKHHYRR
jgi:hypothetical protein